MKQVFINLLLNACEALEGIDKPRITIKIFTSETLSSISFSDNGKGIPSEALASLFDIFYSSKDSSSTRGVGLAICESVVARHNGFIDVKSIGEQGSTFTISLPRNA